MPPLGLPFAVLPDRVLGQTTEIPALPLLLAMFPVKVFPDRPMKMPSPALLLFALLSVIVLSPPAKCIPLFPLATAWLLATVLVSPSNLIPSTLYHRRRLVSRSHMLARRV